MTDQKPGGAPPAADAQRALAARYDAAVESFVDKVRGDPNVIAVIVYGSVAQGTVWEKSDIDMKVIVRDQKLDNTHYGLYEDDLLLNVDVEPRSVLKRYMERAVAGGIDHSFGATSRIVYTTDESLYDYLEDLKKIGQRDLDRALFWMAGGVAANMEKIRKWIEVKRDLDYARLYVMYAANCIAQMDVCSRYTVPTREAILQSAAANPPLMDKFFYQPLAAPMSAEALYALLDEMAQYLAGHRDALIRAAEACFGDGEMKTGTQISRFYQTSIHAIDYILDYLCDLGYLTRVSQTIRLTPKSRPSVEEMAYIKTT